MKILNNVYVICRIMQSIGSQIGFDWINSNIYLHDIYVLNRLHLN